MLWDLMKSFAGSYMDCEYWMSVIGSFVLSFKWKYIHGE